MKTKLLLVLLISTAFTSCSHFFPHSDDDGDTQELLTEYNYVYEGDFYKFALNVQKDALEEQILIWEAVSPNDVNYNDAQQDIAEAQNLIENINSELASIIDIGEVSIQNVPRIPRPPVPPLPCSCIPVPNLIRYATTLDNINELSLTILDEDGEILFNSTPNNPLMDVPFYQGTVRYQNLDGQFQNHVGPITIFVNRTDNQGFPTSYSAAGYMYQP
ncbi:MAG: hypothetical protein ACSHXF_16750 [Aquaticitalea sp.]